VVAWTATTSGAAPVDDFEIREGRILEGAINAVLVGVTDVAACAATCDEDFRCASFTYQPQVPRCELKGSSEFAEGEYPGFVSGVSRPIRRYMTLEAKTTEGTLLDAGLHLEDANQCARRCDERGNECRSFTYDAGGRTCWLRDGTAIRRSSEPASYLTGIKLSYTDALSGGLSG
jgi:hypothetical protein